MSIEDRKAHHKAPPYLSTEDFSLFQKLFAEESGLRFDRDRSGSLCDALWSRMQTFGYDSYKDYHDFLKTHREGREEFRRLADLVMVGETFFFRHKAHFDILRDVVLPEITHQKTASASRAIRIWSAGCSRGDEPYSIAIAVMEAIPDYKEWDISILGTDMDRHALSRAREAVYTHRDVEQMHPEYLHRYFEKKGSVYHLKDSVKGLVRFEDHNLAKDPFTLRGMQHLDIIFCRNVTIYFDLQTVRRIIDHFYHCLAADGYLFIGYAETLWQISDKFRTIEFPHAFLYQKSAHAVAHAGGEVPFFIAVPEIDPVAVGTQTPAPVDTKVYPEKGAGEPAGLDEKKSHPSEPDARHKKATALFLAKRYGEALKLFDEILAHNARDLQSHFLKATILANQAKYEEALGELGSILDVDNLFADAYYLSGVLWHKLGNLKEAETQFRKVIYVDPGIALTYFNLANLYLCQKKYAPAAREFTNAVRLLEKLPADEILRFSEDVTAGFLLKVCRNNLEAVKKEV